MFANERRGVIQLPSIGKLSGLKFFNVDGVIEVFNRFDVVGKINWLIKVFNSCDRLAVSLRWQMPVWGLCESSYCRQPKQARAEYFKDVAQVQNGTLRRIYPIIECSFYSRQSNEVDKKRIF